MDALPRALPIQTYQDGIPHPVSAVALDDDSTMVAVGCDKNLVGTDLITQQVKRRFQGHLSRINAIAISRDAETYLSAHPMMQRYAYGMDAVEVPNPYISSKRPRTR